MAKDNITSEEKLLEIIEKPQSQTGNVTVISKKNPINIKALGGWLKRIISADKKTIKFLNLKRVNKIIIGAAALLTISWIFDFIHLSFNLKKRLKNIVAESMSRDSEKMSGVNVDIAFSIAEARKRNIFTFLPSSPEAIAYTDSSQLLVNLKLVGIMWSDNPQVMIEDTKEKRTFLLSAGENIGEFKIKKIFRDKVLLGKEEMEWELR